MKQSLLYLLPCLLVTSALWGSRVRDAPPWLDNLSLVLPSSYKNQFALFFTISVFSRYRPDQKYCWACPCVFSMYSLWTAKAMEEEQSRRVWRRRCVRGLQRLWMARMKVIWDNILEWCWRAWTAGEPVGHLSTAALPLENHTCGNCQLQRRELRLHHKDMLHFHLISSRGVNWATLKVWDIT